MATTTTTTSTQTERPLDLPEFPEFRGRLVIRVSTSTVRLGPTDRPLVVEDAQVTLDGVKIAQEQIFQTDLSTSFVRLSNSVKAVLSRMREQNTGSGERRQEGRSSSSSSLCGTRSLGGATKAALL